jgi:hypothetical protein
MRTIVNKTPRPLRIHLSQGKVLHLGPLKEGQIATHDADSEGITKLVEAGEIEILGEGPRTSSASGESDAAHPDTSGHHPHTTVKKRGDR